MIVETVWIHFLRDSFATVVVGQASYYLKSFAPELAYFNLCGMKVEQKAHNLSQ